MSDPSTWEQLSHATRDALWKAAQLADAALPASIVCGGDAGVATLLGPASRRELVVLKLHPLWGHSVALAAHVRSSIRAGAWTIGGQQLDSLQELVSSATGFYFSHVLDDAEDMRESAALLEPHLETLTELARRLELWSELAHLLHRRAVFTSWEGGELDRALKYAQESVTAFRKANGNKPHPGTLALFESELAHALFAVGRVEKARDLLLEAEQNLLRQVGSDGLEPYLLYCQLAQVAKAAGDRAHLARAEREAQELADDLASDAAHRDRLLAQLASPRPWSRWHVERYAGL